MRTTTNTPPEAVFDLHEKRRCALDADVDLRTLVRALAGRSTKPSTRRRIARALAARGLLDLLPDGPTTESDG